MPNGRADNRARVAGQLRVNRYRAAHKSCERPGVLVPAMRLEDPRSEAKEGTRWLIAPHYSLNPAGRKFRNPVSSRNRVSPPAFRTETGLAPPEESIHVVFGQPQPGPRESRHSLDGFDFVSARRQVK